MEGKLMGTVNEQDDVGGNHHEDCVFEISSGEGRKARRCACAYRDGKLYASPNLIGMSDMEAALCVAHDGMDITQTCLGVVVPVWWMIKERPKFTDDLNKFSEMADELTSSWVAPEYWPKT
jgi:hypothetical protein